MYLVEDLTPLRITYVGRLKDSRKGFELLLDALSHLLKCTEPRPVKVRIVGGSPHDVAWAVHAVRSRPDLARQYCNGLTEFWGAVERNFLAELYSRSDALVVPSFREQFGMVAVESMMCGCPVIAAGVGGLKEVVVHDRTGTVFEPGDSLALASAVATYRRNGELAAWHGQNAARWARHRYSLNENLDRVERILANSAVISEEGSETTSLGSYEALRISEVFDLVENCLKRKVLSWTNLSSSQSLSVKVETEEGSYFAKQHSARPRLFACLHQPALAGKAAELPRQRVKLVQWLDSCQSTVKLVACDLDAGLVVQEWVDAPQLSDFSTSGSTALEIIRGIRKFGDGRVDLGRLDEVLDRLESKPAAELDSELLGAVDCAVAHLHAPLLGGALCSRRFHPQLELLRIKRHLHENRYWLPASFVVRADGAIASLLHGRTLERNRPRLNHGSMKKEHLLTSRGSAVAADFDHCGYYCGPFDEAHFCWDWAHNVRGNPAPRLALGLLEGMVTSESELYLGVCWILAAQLNRDLVYFSRGESRHIQTSLKFLFDFPEAVRECLHFTP